MPVCAVGEERTTTILDTTAQRARHPGLSGARKGRDMDEYDRRRDTIEAVACGLIMLAMIPVGAILCALMAA